MLFAWYNRSINNCNGVTQMTKVSDLYTLYLKSHHLPQNSSAREATIERANVETLHIRPTEEKRLIVISFKGKPHKLILNQGNANRMVSIAGDDIAAWPGVVISLRRGSWGSKPTIIIEPHQNGKEK